MSKRLFFGMDSFSPWPETMPQGRIIDEEMRHLTFIFLGQSDLTVPPDLPHPAFKVGFAGYFDSCLTLARVIAWRVNFGMKQDAFINFQAETSKALGVKSERAFTPHVTVCRNPIDIIEWKKSFRKLPVISHTLHLFESLGHSKYNSLWNLPFLPPFVEIRHTADIAFLVRGESLAELYWNAFIALSFHFPEFLEFYEERTIGGIDDIIIGLNELISKADSAVGTPYKAVSFHGDVKEINQVLEWEMIIDV